MRWNEECCERHARNMAMLDGVEVNVIGVPRKIAFVPQHVLPIPPPPNPAFAFTQRARRDGFS
jgi:hypothetical protein